MEQINSAVRNAKLFVPIHRLLFHEAVEVIHERLDNVDALVQNATLRTELRSCLKSSGDVERALSRLVLRRGGPRDMLAMMAGLRAAADVRGLLEIHAENLSQGLLNLRSALGGHENIIDEFSRALSPDAGTFARDGNFVASGYSAALDELRGLRDDGRKMIAALQQKYAESTGINILKIRHNNVIGYHIEITQNHQSKVPVEFIHRQTLANNLRYTTVELSELERKISEAADRDKTGARNF